MRFHLIAGSRVNANGETVWSVDYPPQYEDEDNLIRRGHDDEEISLTQLLEGKRLIQEGWRLNKTQDKSMRTPSPVIGGLPKPVLPKKMNHQMNHQMNR
jgi:hypothetical protein